VRAGGAVRAVELQLAVRATLSFSHHC
jgi:hypothetical protein